MRFNIEYDESNVEKVVKLLNSLVEEEINIFEIEKECLKRGISSSDYLFFRNI